MLEQTAGKPQVLVNLADIVAVLHSPHPENGTQRAHLALVSQSGLVLRDGEVRVVHLAGLADAGVVEASLDFGTVGACGHRAEIDSGLRRAVLRVARKYMRLLPLPAVPGSGKACVYDLEPANDEVPVAAPNPNNPSIDEYRFSCSTFVHHCYSEAWRIEPTWLVDLDSLPTNADHLLDSLFHQIAPPAPVRRLFPGYVLAALKAEQYPFSPEDWAKWRYPYLFLETAP